MKRCLALYPRPWPLCLAAALRTTPLLVVLLWASVCAAEEPDPPVTAVSMAHQAHTHTGPDVRQGQRRAGIVLTGGGASVFLAGVAAHVRAAAYRDDATFQAYRRQLLASQDPCSAATGDGRDDIEELCKSQERWKAAAITLDVVGLATTITGATLWATSKKNRGKARFGVRPQVSANKAIVDVRYRF